MPSATDVSELHRVGRAQFAIVDVPALGYLMIDGAGAPEHADYGDAVQALYSVSYGVHFAVKKEHGGAPKVLPLEAQWWVDDPGQQAIVEAVAAGQSTMADTDRTRWRWRAMIVQPDHADKATVTRVIDQVRRTKDLPALDRLRYEVWQEGRCAQVLHVGPYSEEAPSIARLQAGITAAGYRPRGRHHEIYLGDPRRAAPQRLRTILRHPVEPA